MDDCDRPAYCQHCDEIGHESDDCATRPAACERCGALTTRDDLYWSEGDLIGDCCGDAALDRLQDDESFKPF